MNIIRKFFGVMVAIAILSASGASAHASDSVWSLDSFYQTINNISFSKVAPSTQPSVAQTNPLVVATKAKVQARTVTVTATAYSSSVDETDDTPFITAKGTYVRDGIIAANFLPFGTAVKIPGMFGDKIFVVEDRMNKRYTDRIDVWMPSKQEAFQFGKRKVLIEIVS